ncbi:MAG: NAD(P)-binding domain-containing protein [Acidobacteriota bacterium]
MQTDVLIVGAGPYGVAVAEELYAQGTDFVIVGHPFALWYDHTLDCMFLRSDRQASQIHNPDDRYDFVEWLAKTGEGAALVDDRVPVAVYRRYLDDVTALLPYPIERQLVTALARHGEGFRATLEDGTTVESRVAVIATGIGTHRHVPEEVAALDDRWVLHSWDTDAIQEIEDKHVLVIGSGQSGAETARSLRLGENRVTWVLRHDPFWFSEPLRLPPRLFKLAMKGSAAFYRLPLGIRQMLSGAVFRTTITPGLKPVYEDPEVRTLIADAAGLRLSSRDDGVHSALTGVTYDLVVSATGFRCSATGLPFLDQDLATELDKATVKSPGQAGIAAPRLDTNFSTRVPNLFMLGGIAEGSYGPAQRFILGSRQAAPRIARAVQQSFAAAA